MRKVFYKFGTSSLGVLEVPNGGNIRSTLGYTQYLQCGIPQNIARNRQNTGSYSLTSNSSRVFDVWMYNGNGIIYYTDDEGKTWNSGSSSGTFFYSPLYINDGGYGLIKGNNSGWMIACTQDNGVTYTNITIPNTQSIIALDVSPSSAYGYVAINNTDGSRNFVKITGTTVTTQNATFTPDYFTIVELGGTEYIFGSYSGSIYKSTDGGVTWSTQNNTTQGELYSTIIDNTIYLYLKSSTGLEISKDEGVTWKLITTQNFASISMDGKNGIMHTLTGTPTLHITADGGYTWKELATDVANVAGAFTIE